jgi:UDP-N-acetyl-D-galactosamine dehydrogenase
MSFEDTRIAVIGLGYVGLPLAAAFGRLYPTIGFDTNERRVAELLQGIDRTGELDAAEFASSRHLILSSDRADLQSCNVYVVAVPTPIDGARRPNLEPLISASEAVAAVLSPGDIVVYESTVYPGATEEECIPVLERISGLRFNKDFFAGYSPERVSPGDKERTLKKIVKVTSGSTPEIADVVDKLYASIIDAGTFQASSIRVAEAAKVIENTQRDVNIALINELSIIFSHLGIDTNEVLDAAATKWNFIRLRPGLVGGHCIGVDPYYLVHKSMSVGYIPDIIRTAREINDGMARNAASRLIKAMIARDLRIKGAKVLVAGFTFKEDCPDTRNTKVVDLVTNLREYGVETDIVDTQADPEEVYQEYGLTISTELPAFGKYDAIVLAVAHQDIIGAGASSLRKLLHKGGVLFDMKAAFALNESDLRL